MMRQVVRERFRCVPFFVAQSSSGTGGLNSLNAIGTFSFASEAQLDPFAIGGRFGTVAGIWLKYRIRRMRITYEPSFETASGVGEIVSGGTSTPTYVSRAFCLGVNEDPAMVIPNSSYIVEMGGIVCNTSRRAVLDVVFRDPRWYYCSTTLSTPTNLDLRTSSPGELMFRWVSTSTTASYTYGHLVFDFDAEFTGPLPASPPIGLLLEQKSDEPTDVEPSIIPSSVVTPATSLQSIGLEKIPLKRSDTRLGDGTS